MARGEMQPLGEAEFYWTYRPEFGPYLRRIRKDRSMTLREASAELGLSFTKLQKMETGGRAKQPTLQLLGRIAALYQRPQEEVLEEAGVTIAMPPDVYSDINHESAFAALMLNNSLRPIRMDRAWLDSFSPLQKKQWIEFALRLEEHVQNGGRSLTDIMEDAVLSEDEP